MIKCLRSEPGVKLSTVQSIMHELVCEVKRWCLDRMHLHGDLLSLYFTRDHQFSADALCPCFCVQCLSPQGIRHSHGNDLTNSSLIQWCRKSQLTEAAQFILQCMEKGCSNVLLVPPCMPQWLVLIVSGETAEFMHSSADGIDSLEFSRLSLL